MKNQEEDHLSHDGQVGLEGVCELVHEILCEFPLGNHFEVFFKPKNLFEIENALKVLNKFAKKYS